MKKNNPDEKQAPKPSLHLTRRELLALGVGVALSPVAARATQDTSMQWHYENLSDIAKLIEAKEISPVELTRHMLDRIAKVDSDLHSYVAVMEDSAMASARSAEAEILSGKYRGPLHGIPVGVKDLCHMRGVPTLAGTKALADFIPDFDATAVASLRAAGAVILGKLALCEGAMGPYHPDFKVPVNPWDATKWSGVSSSGSGVATAAGLCFASIGTDTGGSIRYPSAANGCVGLKPTYGRVSRYGVVPLAESLDHIGPMARTVQDTAILFDTMAGVDADDPTSLFETLQPVHAELARGVTGLRVGIDRRYATENVEAELVDAIDAVVDMLSDLGVEIVEVEMPDVSSVASAWWTMSTAEAAAFHSDTYPSRASDYGSGFRAVLDYGLGVNGTDYANAAKIKAEFSGRLARTLGQVDCLVCPSMSNAARGKLTDPYGIEEISDWAGLVQNDVHTKPFNFSGSPTLSVPCGFSSNGLPYSVQFVGNHLGEATICRIGHAYEQATSWHTMHPDV